MNSKDSIAVPSPAPAVVTASQDWDGNDGPWSSFTPQIGNPAQDVKVLVSTSGYQTLVVLPQGCTTSDPPECAQSRGNQFDPSHSTTWNNISWNSTFTLDLDRNLGYGGNGWYGHDTVALDWQGSGGPSLNQQLLAGIATKDFYLGLLGLDPRPTNFTNFDHPWPSYIASYGINPVYAL